MSFITGLVAYYKFDESSGTTASDSSGNLLSLSLVNTPSWVTGKINNGLQLTASSSQYGTKAYNSLFDITGNITISAWVNLSTITHDAVIAAKGDGSVAWNWLFSVLNTSGKLQWSGGTGGTSTGSITTGAWHFIAVTCDNTKAYFYIDGSFDSSPAGTFGSTDSNATWVGYNDYTPNPFYLDGIIDELGIWSRSLSATEIYALYNSGNGLQYPFTTNGNRLSLLGVG